MNKKKTKKRDDHLTPQNFMLVFRAIDEMIQMDPDSETTKEFLKEIENLFKRFHPMRELTGGPIFDPPKRRKNEKKE